MNIECKKTIQGYLECDNVGQDKSTAQYIVSILHLLYRIHYLGSQEREGRTLL